VTSSSTKWACQLGRGQLVSCHVSRARIKRPPDLFAAATRAAAVRRAGCRELERRAARTGAAPSCPAPPRPVGLSVGGAAAAGGGADNRRPRRRFLLRSAAWARVFRQRARAAPSRTRRRAPATPHPRGGSVTDDGGPPGEPRGVVSRCDGRRGVPPAAVSVGRSWRLVSHPPRRPRRRGAVRGGAATPHSLPPPRVVAAAAVTTGRTC